MAKQGLAGLELVLDSNLYLGYFQNQHMEQWVFLYDYTTNQATLRGGDCNWERSLPVVDGLVPGTILNPEEEAWLRACWQAATAF